MTARSNESSVVGQVLDVLHVLARPGRDVRDRHVREPRGREGIAVDLPAGRDEHPPVAFDAPLLEQGREHALVEAETLGHRGPSLPRRASRQPSSTALAPARLRAVSRWAPTTTSCRPRRSPIGSGA